MVKLKVRKVYYAHAMPTYGTKIETLEKKLIAKLLPKHKIVDPGSIQENIEKRKGGMEYCFSLIDRCDALVFSRYKGIITSGVGKEIDHALENKLVVHELKNGKLEIIKSPVKYLSRVETWAIYGWV